MLLFTSDPTCQGIIDATPFTGLFTSVYDRLLRAATSCALACAMAASASSRALRTVFTDTSLTT